MKRLVSVGALCASAIVMMAAVPVAARPLEREHYTSVDTDTFTNGTAAHTLEARFTAGGPSAITGTAGLGGAISPAGGVSVACGASPADRSVGKDCHISCNARWSADH